MPANPLSFLVGGSLKGPPRPEDDRLEPAYRPHLERHRSSPTPATAGSLLRAVGPVIANGTKAYGGAAAAGPAIRGHAKRIALDAFDTYDQSRGTLKNHLLTNLQGLQRHAARQGQMIHVPERVAMDRQTLDAGERELQDELGRAPSTLELADRVSINPKRQAYIRGYSPGFAEGQVDALAAEGGGGPAGPAVEREDAAHARASLIYHDLDGADQLILEHGIGLHGRQRLTTGEIARRLNRTPGAVSQRAAKIQAMLDEVDDMGML